MHERNTFLKFITLVYELMISTNYGLSKSAVKIKSSYRKLYKGNNNYLNFCVAVYIFSICAVYLFGKVIYHFILCLI